MYANFAYCNVFLYGLPTKKTILHQANCIYKTDFTSKRSKTLTECFVQFGKSFIKIENNKGSRLLPCGTPEVATYCFDNSLSTLTC